MLTIPNPNLKDGDDFSVDPLMANILVLLSGIQSFDGSQIQPGTVAEAALAPDLSPLARDYNMFQSFISSGLMPSGYTVFTLTVPNGVAFVKYNNKFTKYTVAGSSYTVSPNTDTYFTLKFDGTIDTPSALANGANLPVLATGSQYLFRVRSNGTGIQGIDDLRNLYPVPTITPFGLGNGVVGGTAPPVNSGLYKMQAASTVVTLSGNQATINFPVPFPAGVMMVIPTDGDFHATGGQFVAASDYSVNGFVVRVPGVATGLFRVNWMAWGF